MKAKFINEDLSSVLKPKNIIGKCYGIKSSATNMLEYIIKIKNTIDIEDSMRVGNHVAYSIEVMYNNFMIEGGSFFQEIQLEDGEKFSMMDTEFMEFYNSYSFKELQEEDVKELEHKIYELTEFKNFLQNLYNESQTN